MVEYQRVKAIAQFGEELFPETQKLLDLGKKLEILFSQGSKTIIPRPLQLFVFGLLIYGFWEDKPQNIMKVEVNAILKNYKEALPELEEGIREIKNLEELKNFVEQLIPGVKEILYRPL
jgi:F0F1-type ATP synthase alpha subunit